MALAVGQPGFIFGGNTGITYDDLQQRRKMLDAIEARRASRSPQNLGEGLQALGEGILGGIQQRQLRKQEEASNTYNSELSRRLASSASDITFGAGAGYGSTDGRYTVGDIGKPAGPVSTDPSDGDIYTSFLDTVRNGDPERGLAGVTNPFGLAAVASTGKRESGYSAKNAYGDWSDPSQSGQAGQAGGVLSWRAERLASMRDFVAKNGGDPRRPSAALQGAFFLAEDPGLVARLNAAKSPEEAQEAMNAAWKFAGWNGPSSERAARIKLAGEYAKQFTGGDFPQVAQQAPQQSVQVASLDPADGMAAAQPPEAPSPTNRVALERAFASQTAQRPPEMGGQDVAAIQARPADPQAVPYEGPGATIDPRDVAAFTGGAPAAASVSTPAMAPGPAPVPPSQIQAHPQGGTVPVPSARPSSPAEVAQAITARRQQGRTVPTQQVSSTPNVGAASASQRTPFDLVAGEALGGNGGALYYAGRNSEAEPDRQTIVQALMERRRAGRGAQNDAQSQASPAVQRVAQATMEAQNRAAAPSAPSATAYDGGQQSSYAQRALELQRIMADPLASDNVRQMASQQLRQLQQIAQTREERAYEASVLRDRYAREDARFAVTDRREDRRDAFDREKFTADQRKPVVVNGRLVNPQTGQVVSDFSDRQTTTVGGVVLDTRTGQPIYTAPDKPTATMQEYDAYARDERAAGRQPIGRLQYEQALKKAGSQTTTINTGGNGSKFIEKSDEAASKRFDDIIQGGYSASQTLGDVQQLAELGRQIGTGKVAQVKAALGPYAETFGIDIANVPEAQAYQSIIARMAPQMRPAGAGATSDFDARQFLQSLPSLGNTPEGNQLITDTFQAVQQNKLQAAEIASQAYLPPEQGGITWQEAERRMRALPNPYERFKATRKVRSETSGSPGASTAAPSINGQRYEGGVPVGGGAQSPTDAVTRARNPQTGETLELRNGQWVVVQ